MTPRPRNATFAIVVLRHRRRARALADAQCAGLGVRVNRLPGPTLTARRDPICSQQGSGRPGCRRTSKMAVTKEQVVEALNKVPAPDGRPLTQAGVLSDVVTTDGKVFFSINVDAAAVPRWEPVRKAAETAVRAVPGVQSAMVALTAERGPGARSEEHTSELQSLRHIVC